MYLEKGPIDRLIEVVYGLVMSNATPASFRLRHYRIATSRRATALCAALAEDGAEHVVVRVYAQPSVMRRVWCAISGAPVYG